MNGFISCENASQNAIYFRKEIKVKDGERVIVSLSALGLVKGYINGFPFDCDYLTPGWQNYHKRIPYYEFDITDKVTKGKNCLAFVVGNGWACGKIAWFGKNKYSDKPYLWCKISILDGKKRKEIFSDESFTCEEGEVRENDIFDGERVDAFFLRKEFFQVGYSSKRLQNAVVTEKFNDLLEKAVAPLVKVVREYDGVLLRQKGNAFTFDFGQNHSGIIRFDVSDAKKNTKITVRYGEMLEQNGDVYVENLRTALCTDCFIVGNEPNRTFSTLFTYHGYRYAEFSIEGECTLVNVKSLFISNDVKESGSFTCSSEMVNKLYQNVKMGQESNFVSVPTDCPQRDERLGWTGDAQVFCKSAMYNADCRDFFRKFLNDVRDAQTEDGMIDCVAPSVSVDFDHHKGAPAWGDVITILPYEYYNVYRDKSIIVENLSAAKRWVDFCLSQSTGYVRPGCGYGDWLSIDDTTDKGVLANLFMGYSAYLVSRMCEIVGDSAQQIYYQLYLNIKDAFIKKYVDKNGEIFSDTQTSYLLAYNFRFLSGKDILPHLLRTIRRRNNHLSTGFVGVKYLLPTLCDLGQSDLAYELLTKTDYPSWGYSVVNGATTIWERWNSYSTLSGFASRSMNSFNHYSLGSVAEWIYSHVLGMRFEERGVYIKPTIDFSGRISHAKGSYRCGDREIFVSWKVVEGIAALTVDTENDVQIVLDDYILLKQTKNTFFLRRKKD